MIKATQEYQYQSWGYIAQIWSKCPNPFRLFTPVACATQAHEVWSWPTDRKLGEAVKPYQ